MIYKGVCFWLFGFLFFCCLQAASLETAMSLFKKTLKLESITKVFDKKYHKLPELVCQNCKMTMSYGEIVGTILGFGLKIVMTGGDAEKHEKIADKIFDIVLEKDLKEIDLCMLNAVNMLQIKCSKCEAVYWKSTEGRIR